MSLSDPSSLILLIGALCLAGAATGFLAGLFGIGGGAISVPIFYQMFLWFGHSPSIAMPLAVGTSLAVIVPTSILSARAHHARGTVDLDVLRLWALPLVAGVVLGAWIAAFAAPWIFQIVFIGVASLNAAKLLFGGQKWRLGSDLPSPSILRLYGGVIGMLSTLMGIGGGALSNLVLTLHNVPIHRAVSTSAGVGVIIAVPGTLGYILAGWGKSGLPPDAVGFVSLATFAMTIPAAMLTTRFGVKLAHRLSRRHLELAFGSFLVVVSLRFLFALLRGL